MLLPGCRRFCQGLLLVLPGSHLLVDGLQGRSYGGRKGNVCRVQRFMLYLNLLLLVVDVQQLFRHGLAWQVNSVGVHLLLLLLLLQL